LNRLSFADEPTGPWTAANGQQVMFLLRAFVDLRRQRWWWLTI
jgi:hypothetical protein